jgi:hypothetical protein
VTADELAARLDDQTRDALEKLGFTLDFIAKNVLSARGAVTVAQTAMLWMGMPNKHDRKRTLQMLELLCTAGLLTRAADESYTVFSG